MTKQQQYNQYVNNGGTMLLHEWGKDGRYDPSAEEHTAPVEEWRIEIDHDNGKYHFRRYINGKVNEQYVPVEKDEACVFASAIINGFEPPRKLVRADDGGHLPDIKAKELPKVNATMVQMIAALKAHFSNHEDLVNYVIALSNEVEFV